MSDITYYELSNYNNAVLIPKTFRLEGVSEEEHNEAIQEWLEELTESTGELCEEWIVCDYGGIPSRYVGEYQLDAEYFEFIEVVEASLLDEEVFEAGVAYGINLDDIEDNYHGKFETATDLAYDYIESTGLLTDVPASIANYFDYESFGRDLEHDYMVHGEFYFHNH